MAADSKGNIYTAERYEGKRVGVQDLPKTDKGPHDEAGTAAHPYRLLRSQIVTSKPPIPLH